MNKRCGYTLTEMLVIIVVLVVFMTLSVQPFRTMISEIPRSARVCQTLNGTQKFLGQLRKDVEQSDRIVSLNNSVLELEQGGKTINYMFSDGKIIRNPAMNDLDQNYIWQFPHLNTDTDLWTKNGVPYAVELTTWNQQMMLGKEIIRFKQTTVFFRKGEQ